MNIEIMYHANYNGWSICINGQPYDGEIESKLVDATNDDDIIDDDGAMCCPESDVLELVKPILDQWASTFDEKVYIQIEFDYVSS